MMKLATILFFGALSLSAMACTTATSGGPAPQTAENKADSKHLTDFQKSRLVGHYSTEDGKSGFVLDMTGPTPVARLDGDTAIKGLTRQGSVHGMYELVSEDHKIWLRVGEESGTVVLFQGPKQHEGVDVLRDADADQLK